MNAVVFEHVKVDKLPQAWRASFAQSAGTRVTVRIEQEAAPEPVANVAEGFVTDDTAFGIWRDRDEMNDVAAYLKRLRAPLVDRDVSRNLG